MNLTTISAAELKEKLRNNDPLRLIDVREPYECRICHLPDAVRIPLQRIPDQAPALDRYLPTVVYCHHGVRSELVVKYLVKTCGFRNVVSLSGGIHAWATEVDTKMRQY
ncbi:MAG: hypothetical protein H7Z75_12890 [Ferruginibacter sp.]|nr:hypothetical protein [Cytophagales bacterium]